MTGEFTQMAFAFLSGLGLLLIGLANLTLRRRSLLTRVFVSALCAVLPAGGAYALTSEPILALRMAGLLASIATVILLAGSSWLAAMLASNGVRWGGAAVAGLGIAVGSVTWLEHETMAQADRNTAELGLITSAPPTEPAKVTAATDLGRSIVLLEVTNPKSEADLLAMEGAIFQNPVVRYGVIRFDPVTDRSNCHGWVFTGGRFWISGAEVERILEDNRYQAHSEPRPGDLVVYRNSEGVLHTALVRYVTQGLPVMVEGKWGTTGVYLHAVDKSVYGDNFTYYRSPRSGHLLAGLASPESTTTATMPTDPDEFTE